MCGHCLIDTELVLVNPTPFLASRRRQISTRISPNPFNHSHAYQSLLDCSDDLYHYFLRKIYTLNFHWFQWIKIDRNLTPFTFRFFSEKKPPQIHLQPQPQRKWKWSSHGMAGVAELCAKAEEDGSGLVSVTNLQWPVMWMLDIWKEMGCSRMNRMDHLVKCSHVYSEYTYDFFVYRYSARGP